MHSSVYRIHLSHVLVLSKDIVMAQSPLYMDEENMDGLRTYAARRGISISAYAREVLEMRNTRDAAGWENGWPPGFFDLEGSCPDFPEVKNLGPSPVEQWAEVSLQ